MGKSEALVQIAVGGDASDRKVKGAGRAGFAPWRSRVYLAALSKHYAGYATASSWRSTGPHGPNVRPRPESLLPPLLPLLTLSANL